MIRIGIADDEELVRDGIAALLACQPGMIVVATVGTARDAVDLACSGGIDVLLLDIEMGDRDGLDALAEIVARPVTSKQPAPVRNDRERRRTVASVIVLSSYPAEQYAVRAIRGGAAGYIRKTTDQKHLMEAIRTVARGGRFLTEEVSALLADFAMDGPAKPHARLSDREFQVFRMLSAGRSVAEIADELALSASSVSTCRRRILEKLGLANTATIIRYAAMHDLI